ncbi:hypothetical protein F5Y10DRAFT_255498 [Nemania abortiva]|nr:hypothetical protein F5Y10DRAFT_255498 [Nemania abortiva]
MSLTAGSRLVRVQPALTVYNGMHHGARSASALPLRLPLSSRRKHVGSHTDPLRPPYSSGHAPQPHSRQASTSRPPPPPPPPPSPLTDPVNPPASTRPPPLDLPVRDAATTGLFKHLWRLGKAYTAFYKAGLLAVFTNRRLLHSIQPPKTVLIPISRTGSTGDAPLGITRATYLLNLRVGHDMARLPLFGLMVLLCGEFTPLIVLLFPRITPYTCRIPSQIALIRRSVEARRAASFRALPYVLSAEPTDAQIREFAPGHICRSLGLGSSFWDRWGFDVPAAQLRARRAVMDIVKDDFLLRHGGGVARLVDEEVVLACEERGIDTLEKDVRSLRKQLKAWLVRSAPSAGAKLPPLDARDKIWRLLLRLDGPEAI